MTQPSGSGSGFPRTFAVAGAAVLALGAAACGGGGGGGTAGGGVAEDALACLVSPRCRSTAAVSNRGSRYFAPENTVAAFDLGIDQGARWVSLDLRRTSDGAIVLMHDPEIDRVTTGTGRIAFFALADLSPFPVLPPDERGELSPEVVFLAATGLRVLVDSPQAIPTLGDVVRRVGSRAALSLDLLLADDGIPAVVRQIEALGAIRRTLFVASSVSQAQLVRAQSDTATIAVRPQDSLEWQAFTSALPDRDLRIVKMNPADPGFASVRAEVAERGGRLFVEAMDTTDSTASFAQAVARQAGATETEALAAARVFYQQLFESTDLTLVQTDRIDVVARFADDWNATQGF